MISGNRGGRANLPQGTIADHGRITRSCTRFAAGGLRKPARAGPKGPAASPILPRRLLLIKQGVKARRRLTSGDFEKSSRGRVSCCVGPFETRSQFFFVGPCEKAGGPEGTNARSPPALGPRFRWGTTKKKKKKKKKKKNSDSMKSDSIGTLRLRSGWGVVRH